MTDEDLFRHTGGRDPTEASVEIDLDRRLDSPVEPNLYAKFCEHLGRNVYHGMEAQILFNPTFGSWPFPAPGYEPSGGTNIEYDLERIRSRIASADYHHNLPELIDESAAFEAYRDGGAFGWERFGGPERVTLSPDVGPSGNRAQRIELADEGTEDPAGVRQRTYLPHHRTRQYECRVKARAIEPTTLHVSLSPLETGQTRESTARASVDLDSEWSTVVLDLDLPSDASLADGEAFEFALAARAPANVVVERVLLYPGDHVGYADPEVVGVLRDARLPLLRWPGGNFASGYHWRDGVGPVDERPTLPNPAWGGLEYNLFGTAEFVAFCEAVGCEPMICVNAGDGTPEEAADWVEYCNGDPEETEMGRLRAEHGHPEPYDVTYWEVGNELYGEWQVNWTTPDGYVDRYRRFHDAMTAVDPSIELFAIGDLRREQWQHWNEHLVDEAGDVLGTVTNHVLVGGEVDATTDPEELFHAFMGFSDQLGRHVRALGDRMREAGVAEPRIALTELQLFASFADSGADGPLSPEVMPTRQTISEALYDATIIHECIRTGDLVEMVTHSATVNHGGGIQKERGRVWADPCQYGHEMGVPLWSGTPVGVDVACNTISTSETFREIDPVDGVPSLDAMAVLTPDETELLLVLVTREALDDAVSVTIDPGAFDVRSTVERVTLTGDAMHARNTREQPERVVPESSTERLADGVASVSIPPYSLTRLRFRRPS